MLTESIIGMVRRRWKSERPYAGNTNESLRRKIASPAVADWAKEAARRELRLRAEEVSN